MPPSKTPPPTDSSDGSAVEEDLTADDKSPGTESLASLQRQLVDLKDARKEERFYAILILIILLDVILFDTVEGTLVPIAILILELILLIPLAKRLGLEGVAEFLSSLVRRVTAERDR